MRRKDREVTDEKRIEEIIEDCQVCRLALNAGRAPYIVPLSFGYERKGGALYLYFHSAAEGRKLELIKKAGYAAFEMDTKGEVRKGVNACGYSYMYASVIGEGEAEILKTGEDKIHALNLIMKHYTEKSDWAYDENVLNIMCVIRLKAEKLSCKEH